MATIMMNAVRIVLRVLTAAAAGVAAVVMATSEETSPFGFLEAKFQYSKSLVFFVAANVIACAYSLLAIVVPSASPAARFVLMADVAVGMMLTGALGAAGGVSEVGKNGNEHAFWQPICGLVPTFCDRIGGALISALVAIIFCFLALIHSIYTATKPQTSEP